MQDVASMVSEVILEIASRDNANLSSVAREQDLVKDLGLDSLDLTELVVSLEMKLERNPFGSERSVEDCKTVGAVCDAYAVEK